MEDCHVVPYMHSSCEKYTKILRAVSTDTTEQDSTTGKLWYLFMNCYATLFT